MQGVHSFDRVRKFLDELLGLPLESLNDRLKDIECDLYVLFKRLERIHSISDEFQTVDMSEDVYALMRMLEHKRLIKRFPLLSRAAGLL